MTSAASGSAGALSQPLVPAEDDGEEGGSSVGGASQKTVIATVSLVLAVCWLCGPWTPLPGWLSTTVLVVALVPTCALLLQLVLVKAAHAVLEKFDRDYLGVDVEIGYLSFNAFTGRFQVQDLVVHNPQGYKGPFLIKAENFVFDLDMRRTVLSCLREVEITEVIGQGITANLEFDGLLYGKSNLTAVLDHIKAASESKADIQPVYSYWHGDNGEHTFHFEPHWGGEERLGCQFFAHRSKAEGTEPVYDFWSSWYREHTFHLGDPEGSMEWRGNVQFHAFPEQAKDTEPVYDFWHVGNKEHTLHFMPAWDREEVGQVRFYAYRKDPTGETKEADVKACLKPVYDFWHSGQGQHQFHFLPAWGGESKGRVQFYAFSKKVPGSEPVCDFYNSAKNKKTFHMGEPREGEDKYSKLFYVYTEQASGTQPVYEFWHEGNQEFNLHCGDPWEGEERREVMFYAYREDTATDRRILLRKVMLQKIKAKSATRLVGASVNLEDIEHEDFSQEFEAVTPEKIVENLLNLIFNKVSVGLW